MNIPPRASGLLSALIVRVVIGRICGAQALPPIQVIDLPSASIVAEFDFLQGVHALSDGRVLINDIGARRLLISDSAFTKFSIVADSLHGGVSAAGSYGMSGSALVTIAGDSTLLMDQVSGSMLTIDPSGRVARIGAIPRTSDVARIGTAGVGVDRQGRLVYRGDYPRAQAQRDTRGVFTMPNASDSSPVVRLDLHTLKVDTIAAMKTGNTRFVTTERSDSALKVIRRIDPLPFVDELGVFASGRIAIVRGQDFRIDFIGDDGTIVKGRRVPFDWVPLSDDEKSAIVDSARAALSSRPMVQRGAVASQEILLPSEIADYRPAFEAGAVRRDADDHLWIRSTTVHGVALGSVYYVIDSSGALIKRIQLPSGKGIVGFGRGGVVYLASREGKLTRVERTNVKW